MLVSYFTFSFLLQYVLSLSSFLSLDLRQSIQLLTQPSTTMSGLPPVFGAACIEPSRAFTSHTQLPELFALLRAGGCTHIDTAALYGQSEELLGLARAGDHFTLDTKTKGGFIKGYATKENVIKDAENSRRLLGCTVDVFYLHAPDVEATPLEDTLEGVNEVYKTGFFKRFGLSNFKAEDVRKVYDICKEKGHPLPEVYQGNCELHSQHRGRSSTHAPW